MTAVNGSWFRSLILVLFLIAAWQVSFFALGERALSSPTETVDQLISLFGEPSFLHHVGVTAGAFVTALGVATVMGVSVGFLLGVHRLSGKVAEPILISFYATPKVLLYPFILLAFGIGMSAKVAFGTIHGFFPIVIFTMNAIRNINPVYLDTARVLKIDSWSTVRYVAFPAAAPEIFTGLRIGFSVTLLGTLLAEMFGSRAGLGFLLMNAIGLHNVRTILAVTLLLVIVAVAANSIMLAYERRLYIR